MKCEICNKVFKSKHSLGLHLSKSHKNINKKEYYDTYVKKENEDICPVCGNYNRFKGGLHGYERTCSVSCGQRHKDTREKISATNMLRYNATNPYGSKIIREKIKQTNLKRYGVENTFCIAGVNEKAVKNSIKNLAWKKRSMSRQQNGVINHL